MSSTRSLYHLISEAPTTMLHVRITAEATHEIKWAAVDVGCRQWRTYIGALAPPSPKIFLQFFFLVSPYSQGWVRHWLQNVVVCYDMLSVPHGLSKLNHEYIYKLLNTLSLQASFKWWVLLKIYITLQKGSNSLPIQLSLVSTHFSK
jgi:hypothetical protein